MMFKPHNKYLIFSRVSKDSWNDLNKIVRKQLRNYMYDFVGIPVGFRKYVRVRERFCGKGYPWREIVATFDMPESSQTPREPRDGV